MIFGAGACALVIPFDAIERKPRAVAGAAPAVLRVVGEQARIELGKAAPARRAGAQRREGLLVKREFDADGTLFENSAEAGLVQTS